MYAPAMRGTRHSVEQAVETSCLPRFEKMGIERYLAILSRRGRWAELEFHVNGQMACDGREISIYEVPEAPGYVVDIYVGDILITLNAAGVERFKEMLLQTKVVPRKIHETPARWFADLQPNVPAGCVSVFPRWLYEFAADPDEVDAIYQELSAEKYQLAVAPMSPVF